MAWSLDHVGPMTRTVEDCALVLQVIAGYDPKDAACANVPVPDYSARLKDGVRGLRLGVPRSWFSYGDGTEAETLAAVDAAIDVLEHLGAIVTELDGDVFVGARDANTVIMVSEAYAYHEQNLQRRPQDYNSNFRNRVGSGAFYSAADYIQATRARAALTTRITAILGDVDAIVTPMMAAPAPSFAEFNTSGGGAARQPGYAGPFNLTGLPAISVPCGFSSTGLPIGMQIAGRAFDEATVLRIAYAYEQAGEWRRRVPMP